MRMRMLGSTRLNVIGIQEQAQGEHWSGYPPTGHAEAARRPRSTVARHGSRTATAGHTGTCDEETACPAPARSARIGNAAKMPGKETRAVTALERLIAGWLGAVVI